MRKRASKSLWYFDFQSGSLKSMLACFAASALTWIFLLRIRLRFANDTEERRAWSARAVFGAASSAGVVAGESASINSAGRGMVWNLEVLKLWLYTQWAGRSEWRRKRGSFGSVQMCFSVFFRFLVRVQTIYESASFANQPNWLYHILLMLLDRNLCIVLIPINNVTERKR